MKNVIIAIFSEESKTYEALSELKSRSGSTLVLTAGVVKNVNGNLTVKDGYNLDDYGANWATGGLLGGVIGLLGGPVGVLLGGGLGTLIGSGVDASQADDTVNILKQVTSNLGNYELALLVIADENNNNELNQFFRTHGSSHIIRESFIDVQTEVYQAQELEEHLAKEAKRKIREEKKAKWRAQAEAKQQELQDRFEEVKERMKKND